MTTLVAYRSPQGTWIAGDGRCTAGSRVLSDRQPKWLVSADNRIAIGMSGSSRTRFLAIQAGIIEDLPDPSSSAG
jgi:ATP-dependent protease HslVU (ClpYQ) peptidase subunit